MSSIRDAWSLDPKHVGKKMLRDWKCIIVAAVAHHQKPTCEPLFETVRTVARDRYQNLLQKCLDVSIHEVPKRWHRSHCRIEYRARHLCRVSWDLDQEPNGGNLGAKDCLHSGASLPAD